MDGAVTFEHFGAEAPGQTHTHATYCRLCEAQCGIVAEISGGRIVKIRSDREHPVSAGFMCAKAPGMLNVTYDPDRITTPMRRCGGPGEFEQVSWDEALDDIVSHLRRQIAADGGKGIGLYMGNPPSFGTMHFVYAPAFLRLLGGTKFFNALHVDTGAKNLACGLVYGSEYNMTFPDLERCDLLLMLGANPAVSHLSLAAEPRSMQKMDDIHARGGVIVVDPRRSETARRYQHVPIKPDSDAWLIMGMLRVIFDEGLADEAGLDRTVNGWRSLREAAAGCSLAIAAEQCGVPADEIRDLGRRFAGAERAACYGRVGTNRGRFSTLTNVLIEALNLVTGHFGTPGGMVLGASIYGGAPPPAEAMEERTRSRIGGLPQISGTTPGGTLAAEITTPGEGQLRTLFVDGGNPVLSYPAGERCEAALEQLEMMVALDFYVTETTRHAHYILPVTTFFERPDVTDFWTIQAPRPWLQSTAAVILPVGEARQEFDIMDAILMRLGLPSPLAPPGADADMRPGYMEAVDYALRAGPMGDQFGAKDTGYSLASLESEYPSGVRLQGNVDAAASWGKIAGPDGKAIVWDDTIAVETARLLASLPEPEFQSGGLKLIGRRKLRSMNSWMHNSADMVRSDAPTLLIHPQDAAARQIKDGDAVVISSKSGAVEVLAEVSDEVIPGAVSYPHGWGHKGGWRHSNSLPGANINLLASDDPADWEQISGMCRLDGIAVSVERKQAVLF